MFRATRQPIRSNFFLALISTVVLGVNVFYAHNILIGSIFFALYFYSISRKYCALFKTHTSSSSDVFATLSAFFLFSLLGTVTYYTYQITPPISVAILALPLLIFGIKAHTINNQPPSTLYKGFTLPLSLLQKESTKTKLLLLFFLLIELFLFTTLFLNRTTDVSNSPWLHTPLYFFALYTLSTTLAIAIPLLVRQTWISYVTTSIHLFLTYAVVIIIYPLGYGFDGFIHRATENWIQTHGFITPKQPVYIGQYSLLVWLSNITAIPIFYLDTYFVPALSSIFLPLITGKVLKDIWNISERIAINLVWFFPVIFYLSLHLTTPHNVLILLTCAVVFASLSYLRDCIPAFHLIILSLAGLAIHALLGAPLFIFVLAILILKKIQKLKVSFLIFYLVGLTFLFPVLFSLYFLLTNNPLPEISNPLRHVYSFLELFRQPYWYKPNAPFLWELLYHWQRILPVLIGLGACISFLFVAKKKKLDELYLLFLFSFIGLWGGAFLLRSWIIFPNVGVFEQGDYPLRLVKSSIIFLIPFLMYGAYMCGMYIHKKITDIPKVSVLIKFFGLFVLSIFITVSLYLAYPQQNAKAHFPGYNVTHADFEAARWIHQQNENYDYIVLSNPLTAIAAMTEYGFPKYFETSAGLHSYYSIPTGAPLFKLYQRMLYEGQEREYMEEAMEFAGVNKSYFVVSSFWSRFDQIVEGAQKSANSWQIIDNGKIWIFLYLKNE